MTTFDGQPPHVQWAAKYQVQLQIQRRHVFMLMAGVTFLAIVFAAPLGLAVWIFRQVAGL